MSNIVIAQIKALAQLEAIRASILARLRFIEIRVKRND